MKLTVAVLAAIASIVSAAPGDGCTTSANASVSIIAPVSGQVLTPGTQFTLVWNQVGGDAAYGATPLTFLIGNAANPKNIAPVSGGALTTVNATIASGQATITVPQIPAGTNYTIEAKYADSTKVNFVCFSPQFTVPAAAPVTTASNATVTATKTGAGSKSSIAGVLAGVAALFAF
ncbi:UNVERIFIED_CONTAM: hypothetical protein HDU68_012268 [Siphonaria sp. JEL0065]|nr:hypothetical protein HDU68_012268 [Siphonaria sp. JEL0065]